MMSSPSPAIRKICFFVFFLTLFLTLGQGLVRYRKVLGVTGQDFIKLNEYDALLHVTLAERVLEGHGYTLPVTAKDGSTGGSEPAFTKAPGYSFLLAGLFGITGFTFSFFPLQCLCGALLSVLVVLVSWEAFGSARAALFAGVAASVHPTLINTASQLYNENVYFMLMFLSIWLLFRWHAKLSPWLALACGVCAGLTALIRESMLSTILALIALAFVWHWRSDRRSALLGSVAIAVGLALAVLPWSIHNYVVTGGEIVPISSASLDIMGLGNNDCAAGGWTEPYYGDSACPALSQEIVQWLAAHGKPSSILTRAQARSKLGSQWIRQHPGEFMKLSFRRAWTIFDPWHPRQQLAGAKKLIMGGYFLVFVFTGIAGLAWFSFQRRWDFKAAALGLILVATYFPLVLLFVSHDHRYALGIHLILACFGGAWIAHFGRGGKGDSGKPIESRV